MKTLKKNLLIAFVLCLSFLLHSQNKVSPKRLENYMLEKLSSDIALTDSQKIELNKYISTYVLKVKEIKQTKKQEQKFQMKKQLNDEYTVFLNNLLTEEQKKQQEIKRDERAKRNIVK